MYLNITAMKFNVNKKACHLETSLEYIKCTLFFWNKDTPTCAHVPLGKRKSHNQYDISRGSVKGTQ